jgi:hypothetical protein
MVPAKSPAEGQTLPMNKDRNGLSRKRIFAIWALIIVASVLVFGAAAEVWVKRQVLSTSAWVNASDKVLDQPEVQAALATYIVNEVYSSVDVKQELEDQLPEDLKGLAGPISAGLRTPATSAVETLLGSSQVRTLWTKVNTTAHEALVRILEDKTRVGSTSNGTVTLDLGEFVRTIAADLGIPQAAVDKIPADAGNITLFQSNELASMQKLVKVVQWMGLFLTIVIVAMYGLAVYLARNRRRRTLRNVGWAIIIVSFLLIAARRITGRVVSSIITDPRYSPSGKVIYSILSELLANVAWALATYGAVIVVGMLIIGPSRPATAVRRFLAPAFNADRAVFWGGAAILYLIVILISPSPAFSLWWSVLLLAAIIGVGLEFLRRRSEVEFPEAAWSIDTGALGSKVGGVWNSAVGRVRSLGGSHSDEASGGDTVSKLERLKALHDSGALDDAEYASAKASLLG